MKQPIFKYLKIFSKSSRERSKDIMQINPTAIPDRSEAQEIQVTAYDYSPADVKCAKFDNVISALDFKESNNTIWINIDGIRKADVEHIGTHFGIHPLLIEDALSIGQRPKMDEIDGILFCQLNMLYYNNSEHIVESEQISIALGKNFVLSIQEDPYRDVFDSLRTKLKLSGSRVRQRGADYLLYSMLDVIVDNYFIVMEKIAARIEELEEDIVQQTNSISLLEINRLRKELIVLQRNIIPVRDLISGIIRSDNELLEGGTLRYFKDISDHIIQAFELCENYRDLLFALQDLYLNSVNLRLNEVMKFIAIVTCLMAPAAIIGGIFGMNFDVIPYSHQQFGFYFAVGIMFTIPLIMLVYFKRRGWF